MDKFKQVPTHALSIGQRLSAPISDPNNGRLRLLAAGMEVTQNFLDKLAMRGIGYVEVSMRDLAIACSFEPQGRGKNVRPANASVQSSLRNDHSDHFDRLINDPSALAIGDVSNPMSARVERPTDRAYDDGLQDAWATDHDKNVFEFREFAEDVVQGDAAEIGLFEALCRDILAKLMEDADALVCLGGTPSESEYPSRHSLHTATIAMAVGVEIGLGEEQVIELGIGCMIHDMGMQEVGVEPFQSKQKLTGKLLSLLSNHPVHSLEIAGRFGDKISETSKLVAYQIHERLDGSGYPRGLNSGQLHTLSKIAAVADAFVALLSPRPHRPGIQGYHAMVHLLDEVKAGKLDPTVVRALLQVTSLYPIGSCVELSNGKVGRVIRTGGTEFNKPTIEMWSPDSLDARPDVVNLRIDSSLTIANSIPSLRSAAPHAIA